MCCVLFLKARDRYLPALRAVKPLHPFEIHLKLADAAFFLFIYGRLKNSCMKKGSAETTRNININGCFGFFLFGILMASKMALGAEDSGKYTPTPLRFSGTRDSSGRTSLPFKASH